jgi:hypothetical protein
MFLKCIQFWMKTFYITVECENERGCNFYILEESST